MPSLGSLLNDLELTPAEAGTLLAHWGQAFRGSTNEDLGRKLDAHAAKLANPEEDAREVHESDAPTHAEPPENPITVLGPDDTGHDAS